MTAKAEWYAPERTFNPQPSEVLLHGLGNRVMALEGELRDVRDENTKLRKERDEYRDMLGTASAEVVRLTTRLLAERAGTR